MFQEAWHWRRNCWIERHPAVTPYDNYAKDIDDDNDDGGVVEDEHQRETEGLFRVSTRRSQKAMNPHTSLVDIVITPAALQTKGKGHQTSITIHFL